MRFEQQLQLDIVEAIYSVSVVLVSLVQILTTIAVNNDNTGYERVIGNGAATFFEEIVFGNVDYIYDSKT